ncbi:MAG: hypothetical protein JSS20_10810, partial [Proteobacteria bacterium]|nr:hypothetical protein [Pseudomonadota bacterium]
MSPNITTKPGEMLPDNLRERLERAAEAGRKAQARSLSRRTRDTYAGEWARFEAWCAQFARTPMPVDEPTLYAFVADMIATGRSPSGGRVAIAAIKHVHDEAHHEMPTSRRLKATLSGWG